MYRYSAQLRTCRPKYVSYFYYSSNNTLNDASHNYNKTSHSVRQIYRVSINLTLIGHAFSSNVYVVCGWSDDLSNRLFQENIYREPMMGSFSFGNMRLFGF
jgi:hypothetical protein